MKELNGEQLVIDLYGCDYDVINSKKQIEKIIHHICKKIKTNIVAEKYHVFEPIGITGFVIISTSHIAIHTWPEYNYAAIDIFSCKTGLPSVIADELKKLFGADEYTTKTILRKITTRPTIKK